MSALSAKAELAGIMFQVFGLAIEEIANELEISKQSVKCYLSTFKNSKKTDVTKSNYEKMTTAELGIEMCEKLKLINSDDCLVSVQAYVFTNGGIVGSQIPFLCVGQMLHYSKVGRSKISVNESWSLGCYKHQRTTLWFE